MKKGFRGSFHLPRCLPALLCLVGPRVGAFLLVIDGDVDADDGEDGGGGDEDVDNGDDVDADDGGNDDDNFSCPPQHHHCITAFNKC